METCPFAEPPVTVDFDPSSFSIPEEIHEQFDSLRSICPVAFSPQMGGFWMLTCYEDIKSCAANSSMFISSVKAVVPSDSRGTRRPPLNTDPPVQTPYRTAIDRTLKAPRLERLNTVLEEHARREWKVLVSRGRGDVTWLNLGDESAPIPAKTAAAWVSAWREQRVDHIKFHSDKLYDMARTLFKDRRGGLRDPEIDPTSSLLAERVDGKPILEEKLIFCLVVGMIAPPILFGNIAAHLAQDKYVQKKLRCDPDLIPSAVEDFIRLYVPYRGFSRTAAHPVTLHGRTIQSGEPITMTYAAANRDPEVFHDPHEFILGRENLNKHLGFGRGRHRCAGMPLARLALQMGLKVMLEECQDWDVNGELQYAKIPEMGIVSCSVRIIAN
ncbi:putative cytochrome P450 [Phaeosphaeriaceae sp. PMI808]|nr:putative cytochrome P450 [Phaeosphaeriaceae sp. PMI808]